MSAILDNLPAAEDELMPIPDDFAVPENLLARIECSEMIVREAGIAFIAIPKHTSYYIRTAEIPLHMIEAVAV